MSELLTSAIKKFKNNFTALISLYFIVFVAFIAVFAYALAPDSSNNAVL